MRLRKRNPNMPATILSLAVIPVRVRPECIYSDARNSSGEVCVPS